MQELRVADQDRFAFKPKRLLAGIAQIYLNLGQETDFIRAVANDGRSYSRELFERFARILKHRAIMTETEVAEVVAFTQRVEDMKATIMMEDEREIPDEFLGGSLRLELSLTESFADPLLSTCQQPLRSMCICSHFYSDEGSCHPAGLPSRHRSRNDTDSLAI